MGIYGESMTLVTEGKILNKIADKLVEKILIITDKIYEFINKRKKEEKKPTTYLRDPIANNARSKTFEMLYTGYFDYWEDKHLFDDLSKIICEINKESSDEYIKYIKSKFGSTDISKIKKTFEKEYGKKDFKVSHFEIEQAENFTDDYYVDKDREVMESNIEALKKYEEENYTNKGLKINSKDNFYIAVNLQVQVFDFIYSLLINLLKEFDDNYNKNYKELEGGL